MQRWNANFESCDKSLENEDLGRPETDVDNEVLQAINCDVYQKVDSVRQSTTFGAAIGCLQSSTTLPETKTPSKEDYSDWWSSAGLNPNSFLKRGETITKDKFCNEIDKTCALTTVIGQQEMPNSSP
ncbi:hypothetical protein TNCV_1397161 [Trichonephila clavipes]|nr:hypothetical protein TNCV_1397161 [Trichonephila clavipes]